MKNDDAIMIRYMGADHARRFVIQRADHKLWTGKAWSKILDCARVFKDHTSAGKACVAIQHKRHRGKKLRTFRVEMTIALVAEEVEEISREALVKFLAEAVRIEVESSIHGDGPVDGRHCVRRSPNGLSSEAPSARKERGREPACLELSGKPT